MGARSMYKKIGDRPGRSLAVLLTVNGKYRGLEMAGAREARLSRGKPY